VAVLTFNGVCPNAVSERGPEELAIALVLGGFQLGVFFGNLAVSVIVAANEVMVHIARCGVSPIVMQEENHQVVCRFEYPADSSAVAGRKPSSAVAGGKPSSGSSAVAGRKPSSAVGCPGVSYTDIEPDLLTMFQRHAMLKIRDEFMSFTPSKCKRWRKKDGTLVIVGKRPQSAPWRKKPKRAGRP